MAGQALGHRVHFYGYDACRARGARTARAEPPTDTDAGECQETKKKRCPPSWARLIHKVFHADPLVCRRCGGKLEVKGYVCDGYAIRRILDELGLAPREQKPPPASAPPHEVERVPVDEEGRELTTR
jgi:hypothetical protein